MFYFTKTLSVPESNTAYTFTTLTATSIEKKIENFQNSAARLALGLRKITPTNVTLAEVKLPPLILCVKFLGLKHLAEASSTHRHLLPNTITSYKNTITKLPKRHLRAQSTLLENLTLQTANLQSLLATTNPDLTPSINSASLDNYSGLALKTSENINNDFDNLIATKYRGQTIIYTDGSKIPDKPVVVASSYCLDINIAESISMNNEISSYTAECIAIDKALEAANKFPDQPILVCADAFCVLQVITNQHSKSKNAYIERTRKK